MIKFPHKRSHLWFLFALSIPFIISLFVLGYITYVQSNSNFHVVQPGQFYRAARMSPATLAETIDRYGIKSILNLEGSRPEQRWYQDETALSNRLNVVHYDYRLSATRFVTSDQVDDLVAIIRKAPKPLLVHCKNGADRTGLISALYREKILGADKTDAYAQLSLKFGHFKYLESDSKRMDESYWAAVE